MTSIAISGSHNAAIAIEHQGQYLVVELERYLNIKNAGCFSWKVTTEPRRVIVDIIEYAKTFFSSHLEFEICAFNELSANDRGIERFLRELIRANDYVPIPHHQCHAAGTFYQSSFHKALVISFDGGGDDGKFNIYRADRVAGIEHIAKIDLDLGFPYMLLGHYLSCVKKEEDLFEGNLVYSGKLMGLCGYGTVREEWLPFMERYYRSESLRDLSSTSRELQPGVLDVALAEEKIRSLGDRLGLPIINRIDGATAHDLIATSQRAFEKVFFETVDSYVQQFPELPLCVTGGCALNIILNSACKERYKRPVFVAPNSNDCGLALGALLYLQKPTSPVEAMYLGIPLLDAGNLPAYQASRPHFDANPYQVAVTLAAGKILGVARGRAEHGPRALGNRSILCDPAIPNVKEYLHSTIKKREKFRPFAPVVRAEDASKYFTMTDEAPYMSYMTMVRPEWRQRLAAITHVDGSARVQTVTAKQNQWLYDLIGEFEKLRGHGVILNTSFNLDSRPILSTLKEAFELLDTTCLDALVAEDSLFLKN